MFLVKQFEKIIYLFRDVFWEYPDYLFFGENSVSIKFSKVYKGFRPFSHILSSFLIIFLIVIYSFFNFDSIIRANSSTLIEGVIVGVNEEGERNTIQRLNPLIISSIQIEKDLNELIYESLVTVDVYGDVHRELVEAIVPNEDGDNYRVKLREGVYWHDSTKENPHELTVKDVEATFNLLEQLDTNASTKSIYSTIANKRIKFIPIEGDDYRFEFELDGAIPNFHELISFKILPAKYLENVNARNIQTSEPYINRNPIGTGKYKFGFANEDQISLIKNTDYHDADKVPQIDNLRFKFFEDENSIVEALEVGQIHSAAGLTTKSLARLKDDTNITLHRTGTIYSQFYSLFFNMAEYSKEELKTENIRRAISSAINRNYIIEILEGEGEEAFGPIGKNSFAYADDVKRYTYDPEFAITTLEEEGWKYSDEFQEYRTKDGKVLEFDMYALDNVDRNKVSDSIKADLEEIGIKVNLFRKPIQELNEQNVLPRNYDLLLFGATTFVDPDRYELFHSSQIEHPGLNITSYKSKEETVKIVERDDGKKDVENVPEVDVRLENGRSRIDKESRIEEYLEFQRIVGSDVPMAFLYHPILNYAVNNRVKNIDILNANTLQERYLNIEEWEIKL